MWSYFIFETCPQSLFLGDLGASFHLPSTQPLQPVNAPPSQLPTVSVLLPLGSRWSLGPSLCLPLQSPPAHRGFSPPGLNLQPSHFCGTRTSCLLLSLFSSFYLPFRNFFSGPKSVRYYVGYFEGSAYREGNGNPLQYSCLENSVDRGAWWAAVHGVAESDSTEAT